jgi:hypothetical protein
MSNRIRVEVYVMQIFLVEADGHGQFHWVLDLGGPEGTIAQGRPCDSVQEAVQAVKELQSADLASIPIHVRQGSSGETVIAE